MFSETFPAGLPGCGQCSAIFQSEQDLTTHLPTNCPALLPGQALPAQTTDLEVNPPLEVAEGGKETVPETEMAKVSAPPPQSRKRKRKEKEQVRVDFVDADDDLVFQSSEEEEEITGEIKKITVCI